MRRDLSYYWRMSLAVTAGAAVASAVLTGALIVGESVRGSLKDLTLERLGGIDHAVTGQRFLPADVADRLAGDPDLSSSFRAVTPAILLQGSVEHADKKTRASQVGLQGVDSRFIELFSGDGDAEGNTDLFAGAEGGVFPPVVVNQGLAKALNAEVGDSILVSLQRFTQVPSGSLLSRDDTASVVRTIRLQIHDIIEDRRLGAFGLAVHQSSSYNAFVPLEALQKALDQGGTVNALVVSSQQPDAAPEDARAEAEILDSLLQKHLSPEELGLLVTQGDGVVTLESDEFILKPVVAAALQTEADERNAEAMSVLSYLANGLRVEDREVPYSTVGALPTPISETFGTLRLVDGEPAPALGDDEILLNAWTAEQLEAQVGDELTLDYFVVGPREDLFEESRTFTVRGILAMEGLAADPTLTQEYPGIAGSTNMSDWDPPFPIDLSKIGAEDENYWDDYRGTPKAFVALQTGRELWGNRWGDLTSMRFAGPPEPEELQTFAESFAAGAVQRLPMAAFALGFQPVKALGLGASGGATDFGGLFIGLSQFVIVSAALLVSLLFGLATEQRAREIGLRLAVGYRPKNVRNMLLVQGGLLAAVGSLIGLLGAVGYAHLMMLGLRTWWLPAVGTSRLTLHVSPTTLIIGFLASLVVVGLTIFLTVRKAGRTPTPQLLRGAVADRASRTGKAARWTAMIALGLAFSALAYAFIAGELDSPVIFGIAGPCLLVGLLAFFAVWIDRPQAGALSRPGWGAYLRMAVINSRRHRGRSLLSTTLVAFAAFLIVTVAAYQEDFSDMELGLDSGAGGYQLLAQADVPLQQNLGDADGRFELGLPDDAEELLENTQVMPFRLLPGDDTSCLNLYQPEQPRILGVPEAQVERAGFTFQQVSEEVENPWTLLDQDLEDGVIPAIGDFNSTQWILKLPLGGELNLENERGEPIRLRLVASLKTSVFQSELLISEQHFLQHFPNQGGFPYFLIQTPDGKSQEVLETLESGLTSYGFDAVTTGEKLESFHAVQNTYLSTFRSLGGLGLLLGTLGLAVVLVRNVMERRRELAALRAFGFRNSTLRLLVLIENLTLLAVGLLIGTVAALATAGSHVLHQASAVPWMAILSTLGAIFLVGWIACWIAARGALKAELLPALKAEV